MKIFFLPALFFLLSCESKSKTTVPKTTPKPTAQKSKVITQSATHLKNGEELEINIPIEGLNDTLNPRVQVNEIPIPFNPISSTEGLAIYKMHARGAVGKYTIPITITHYKKTGEWKTDTFTVIYYIDK